jgi:hypothetical protein
MASKLRWEGLELFVGWLFHALDDCGTAPSMLMLTWNNVLSMHVLPFYLWHKIFSILTAL